MKYILIPLIFLLVLASCKKPKIESIATNNTRDSLSYQPSVVGSFWEYNRNVSGLSNAPFDFRRIDKDSSINGQTYRVFSNTNDGNQFLRNTNGKYYMVLTASTNKPELLILDTAKNVGESWVGGVNGDDTYTYTMKQKIPIYKLDGFTFKNVLVIHQERFNSTNNNTTLSGDTYYAQGVGQVLSEGRVSGFNVTIKLLNLDLK